MHLKLFWCSLNPFPQFLSPVTVTYYKLFEDWWLTILSLLYGRISLSVFSQGIYCCLLCFSKIPELITFLGTLLQSSHVPQCCRTCQFALHKAPWLTFSTSLGQLSTLLKMYKMPGMFRQGESLLLPKLSWFYCLQTF